MRFKTKPKLNRSITASSIQNKPEVARIAEQAADLIETLFRMNAEDEVDLSGYLSIKNANTLSEACNILMDIDHYYTVNMSGW